jgi:large subunit ribosomal protein L10
MKNRDQKKKDFESLRQEFEKTPSLFVTGFEKMTVEQDFQLRKIIRGAGGGYEVVKNTVAGKASKGTPAEGVLGALTGMNSIAFTSADPVALAKILSDYAKGNAAFSFKAGIVEGRVIDVAGIEALATMPPKDQIYAQLLYLINAPAQRLATAISGVARNLTVVVDQGVKENKFSG